MTERCEHWLVKLLNEITSAGRDRLRLAVVVCELGAAITTTLLSPHLNVSDRLEAIELLTIELRIVVPATHPNCLSFDVSLPLSSSHAVVRSPLPSDVQFQLSTPREMFAGWNGEYYRLSYVIRLFIIKKLY